MQLIESLEDRRFFSASPVAALAKSGGVAALAHTAPGAVAALNQPAPPPPVTPTLAAAPTGASKGKGKGQSNKPTFTTFDQLAGGAAKTGLQTLATAEGVTLTTQKVVVHTKVKNGVTTTFYSTEYLVNGVEKEIAVNADGTPRVEEAGETEVD